MVIDTSELKTTDRKSRLRMPRQPSRKQRPEQRVQNWLEVYEGYDLETAKLEAMRCIQCPAVPCQKACPLDNDIPGALLKLESGDVLGAAAVFRETNPVPDMCGRLCPQESLCEGSCVVGETAIPVAIGRLEAFVADYQRDHGGRSAPELAPSTGKQVAVVGSGPAGLAVAEVLARSGHGVKVFEAWPRPGGVLRYGIPSFRMDKRHVDDQVDYLHALGIQFVFDRVIGRDVPIDQLIVDGYDAVFLGYGAGRARRMGTPGEELDGVYTATEFLVRTNLEADELPAHMRRPLKVGKSVVVIGGGDTAMDCVRSAVRTGAETVVCAYRRNESEMTGLVKERRYAKEEGVEFVFLVSPVEILPADDDESVRAVRLQRMELGEEDESGRRRPEPIAGSEFEIEADTVVVAIGYEVDATVTETTHDLCASERGTVAVDRDSTTSRSGVFAAGHNVRGADLVVTALADAKRAAVAINEYLSTKSED